MAVDFTDLTEEQIEECREAFQLFVCCEEVSSAWLCLKKLGTVMRALGQNPTDFELLDIINEVDVDGSGCISFSEFLTVMARRMKDDETVEELIEVFKILDKDGD